MQRLYQTYKFNKRAVWALLACLVLLVVFAQVLQPASAALLGNRKLLLSTSEISAKTEFQLSCSLTTPGIYGSLAIEVCSNDPLPGRPCTVPAGFDISNATLASQTGPSGFTIQPGATSNRVVLGRAPAVAPVGPVSYDFQNVTNPSSPGSYYVRLQTFASGNATGSAIDAGGIGFASINSLSITATVPPYLTFCTGITIASLNCANAQGDYIDYGELSSTKASSGSSQMLVATNAIDGYNVTVSGTTMTSGVNAITALASNDVSRPGTSQFGMNLHANTSPAGGSDPSGPGVTLPAANYYQANSYRFANGETIVANSVPDDVRLFTASYIVNVPKSQAPGIYVTTITYICLASF